MSIDTSPSLMQQYSPASFPEDGTSLQVQFLDISHFCVVLRLVSECIQTPPRSQVEKLKYMRSVDENKWEMGLPAIVNGINNGINSGITIGDPGMIGILVPITTPKSLLPECEWIGRDCYSYSAAAESAQSQTISILSVHVPAAPEAYVENNPGRIRGTIIVINCHQTTMIREALKPASPYAGCLERSIKANAGQELSSL
ncbi:hypothetical protein DFH06DRAFT_1121451 [Mycena polygramma]|nr:hypothetical protein DFH06DRAFT_1121451 [Mycena polygramma]